MLINGRLRRAYFFICRELGVGHLCILICRNIICVSLSAIVVSKNFQLSLFFLDGRSLLGLRSRNPSGLSFFAYLKEVVSVIGGVFFKVSPVRQQLVISGGVNDAVVLAQGALEVFDVVFHVLHVIENLVGISLDLDFNLTVYAIKLLL